MARRPHRRQPELDPARPGLDAGSPPELRRQPQHHRRLPRSGRGGRDAAPRPEDRRTPCDQRPARVGWPVPGERHPVLRPQRTAPGTGRRHSRRNARRGCGAPSDCARRPPPARGDRIRSAVLGAGAAPIEQHGVPILRAQHRDTAIHPAQQDTPVLPQPVYPRRPEPATAPVPRQPVTHDERDADLPAASVPQQRCTVARPVRGYHARLRRRLQRPHPYLPRHVDSLQQPDSDHRPVRDRYRSHQHNGHTAGFPPGDREQQSAAGRDRAAAHPPPDRRPHHTAAVPESAYPRGHGTRGYRPYIPSTLLAQVHQPPRPGIAGCPERHCTRELHSRLRTTRLLQGTAPSHELHVL